ncbi:uncharacterized protein A1O9_07506 [Exophiala aquamarina CBS 119918]|uniref:FAM192A/Fyv6 N-terminal domain-containing protein n=1 Tax=Exophiala aquamarina CBS 119918 TaxID=1182545 RepID=A0A072P7U2_9EURO|nr:uncharacterized protein A1O9_07506 [Exophiala aquamarina CBS 119918]KEF55926.1 hypothetical protein A1O9_07506 [Exophiala aquamarina CBS 119918]
MSRFVSAGTDVDPRPPDDAWVQAQQAVEAKQQPKPTNRGAQEDGKSLYEVLQQNKAAKQEAFEEAARLKNQFRALDDDEVDFLDSVLESTRAKENAVKEETAEQLDAFRKQRALAEQSLLGLDDENSNKPDSQAGDAWSLKKKKRRRDEDHSTESAGVGTKVRKTSSSATDDRSPIESLNAPAAHSKEASVNKAESSTMPTTIKSPSPSLPQQKPSPVSAGLGLGGYTSDEDD